MCVWNSRGRGKAPLTVVPGDWGLHMLSLSYKLNDPLKPKWGVQDFQMTGSLHFT